jgi:demethylmenaquinone methyltransferase/2-methoxy-6-polyprenyl-1,4-benzoquinol methylase
MFAFMDEDSVSFGFEDVSREEKSRRVKGVFASVAGRYDLMNDLMSAGVHRIWKANMIAWLNPQPGETLIDVAGGTGDIARAFQARANEVARRRNSQAETLTFVSDINEAMLVAGIKASDRSMPRLACDAAALPFPDRCADAVTISFGIRNVVEIDTALSEFRRVLRPGGRFACLEFSHMTHRILQEAYDQYSFKVIPWLGERVTGDRASYQYLIESIRRFPPQDDFAARIRAAGFSEVAYRNYSGGIACLHTGWAV